jgi:hypothetical protein
VLTNGIKQEGFIMLRKVLYLLFIVLFVVSCVSFDELFTNDDSELGIAVSKAASDIISKVPSNSKVSLFNISTNESTLTEYVIEELSVILVSKAQLIILDRYNLDIIRAEHDFQLSGEVHDDDIISIGRKSGASFVISCSITGEDDLRRLRVRTLEVETGRVQSLTSHTIKKLANDNKQQATNTQNQQNQQYEDLLKFIEAAETKLKLTFDYVTKSEICWSVIHEIDYFLYDSDDQKVNESVSITQSVWSDRAINFDKTWEYLTNTLMSALEEKAKEVSISKYSGYNIREINPIDFNISRLDGTSALMSVIFYVDMRGNIIGWNERKFKLTVRGAINMRTDRIEVYEGYVEDRI